MTSLCQHPSPLTVLVFTRFGPDYQPLPLRYLNCRVLTLSLEDAVAQLTSIGWHPESICDPPGSSRLGKATDPTLLGTLAWDKDFKHSACSNHLRFYLPEFPILRRHARILFVDDDVVIMKDSVATLYHRPLPPGVLLTGNCDVNIWNDACQRFGFGRSTYEHFFQQAVYPPGSWDRVLALLRDASGGAWSYDGAHFEWNFGFNLMELDRHRAMNFSARYEAVASRMLGERFVRGDSLMYGLGTPFFAYRGHVECYSRDGFHVLDGLGYVPPVEAEVAGVTRDVISRASVLHFNGERKPWGARPFDEYMEAMGRDRIRPASFASPGAAGQQSHAQRGEHGPAHTPSSAPPVVEPMKLVILLSGPRTGTEWLAKVLSDDSGKFCGSLEDRTAPHPEALMPFNVQCRNASEAPCTSWKVEELTNSSCDLRLMCHWRYVLAAARGLSVTAGPLQGDGFARDRSHAVSREG